MNKIKKALRKLHKKKRQALRLIFKQLSQDYRSVPGVKAIRGKKGWFRVRVGRYRIIFELRANGNLVLHDLIKRDDQTYKNL